MTDEFAALSAKTGADWNRWLSRNANVSDEGVTLATTPVVTERSLGFKATDIDLNPNGNLAVLTESGRTSIYVGDDKTTKPLRLSGYSDVGLQHPDLIGSTGRHLYVIDRETGRAAAFSRRLRRLEWTTSVLEEPVAAVGSQRRLYVLERTDDGGLVRTIGPDGRSSVIAEDLHAPRDLTVDTDETLYVLDDRPDGRVLLSLSGTVGQFDGRLAPVDLDLPEGFRPSTVAAQSPTELVFHGRSDESTLLRYSLDSDEITAESPLAGSWTGLVSGTIGDSGTGDRVYMRSQEDRTVQSLEQDQEYRKDPENTRYEGRLIGRFDAGKRNTQWHRATLDITENLPGNRIDIKYYASECETAGIDDLSALSGISDRQRSELEQAGVTGLWDLIEYTPQTLTDVVPSVGFDSAERWVDTAQQVLESEFEDRPDAHEVTAPTDVLLQEATGRYLHVLVRFVGSRESSPRLNSLRAICPRQSYLRYLPELYQQAGESSTFLERFLSVFETTYVDVTENLDRTTQYLDAQEIPTEYLSWLNGWLALELGETWPESARRELLSRAPELYKMRGTKRGLLTVISLYLDAVSLPDSPWDRSLVRIDRQLDRLVEQGFLTGADADLRRSQCEEHAAGRDPDDVLIAEYEQLEVISDPEMRQRYARLFGHPRRFQVLLQPSLPDEHVRAIKTIAESEKPLYTDVSAEKLQRRFQVNGNTYLGINTYLPNCQFEIGRSALGTQTTLDQQRTVINNE